MIPSDSHTKVVVLSEDDELLIEASLVLAPTTLRMEKTPMQKTPMRPVLRKL
jgi:hypothetical protein